MKNNREIGKKIAIAFSIVLTVFWLFPYIYVICCSFKPGAEVIAVPPRFFPTVLTVENFSGLFARMDVGGYLLNSLITAVCSTVIAVILGSLSAYAINSGWFPFCLALSALDLKPICPRL